MSPQRPRPVFDFWRDVDGVDIPDQCRVEQIAVGKEHGALPAKLHKRGEMIGRGTNRTNVGLSGAPVAARR